MVLGTFPGISKLAYRVLIMLSAAEEYKVSCLGICYIWGYLTSWDISLVHMHCRIVLSYLSYCSHACTYTTVPIKCDYIKAAMATQYRKETTATVYIALIYWNVVLKTITCAWLVAKINGALCASITMMEWGET